MTPAPLQHSAPAELPEYSGVCRDQRDVVGRVHVTPAQKNEDHNDGNLENHDHSVDHRGFFDSPRQDQRNNDDDEQRWKVYEPVDNHIAMANCVERRHGELFRQRDPEMPQQVKNVATPSDRNSGGSDGVLQNQIPPDHPGKKFAHGCVSVSVCAARNRDHRRKFAVAHCGESTADGRDDERKNDSGTRVLRGHLPGQCENAGSNHSADAKRDQRTGTKAAPKRVLAFLRFGEDAFKWLGGE